jgi:hypothetical protein
MSAVLPAGVGRREELLDSTSAHPAMIDGRFPVSGTARHSEDAVAAVQNYCHG